MFFLKRGDERVLVIGRDLVRRDANAAAEAEIDEVEHGHALAPALLNELRGEMVGFEEIVPSLLISAMVSRAGRNLFAQLFDGLPDLGRRGGGGLLLLLHLLEDEGSVNEATEGSVGSVLTGKNLQRLESGKVHFLLDVALQQDIGADDGDDVIEFKRTLSRGRGGWRWGRQGGWPLRGGGQRHQDEWGEEGKRARGKGHQKACPMLKKKLKWPARPTQGGACEESSQELEVEVEVEPYPMMTG